MSIHTKITAIADKLQAQKEKDLFYKRNPKLAPQPPRAYTKDDITICVINNGKTVVYLRDKDYQSQHTAYYFDLPQGYNEIPFDFNESQLMEQVRNADRLQNAKKNH